MNNLELHYSNPVEFNGVIFQSVVQSKIFIPILPTKADFQLGINVTNQTSIVFCFKYKTYFELSNNFPIMLIAPDGNKIKPSGYNQSILGLVDETYYLVESEETVYFSLESRLYRCLSQLTIAIRYSDQFGFIYFPNLKHGIYKIGLSYIFRPDLPQEFSNENISLGAWSGSVSLPLVEFKLVLPLEK